MKRVTLKFRIRHAEYRIVKEVDSTFGEVFSKRPPIERYYVTKHYPLAFPPRNRPVRVLPVFAHEYFETEMGAALAILRSLEDFSKPKRPKRRGRK